MIIYPDKPWVNGQTFTHTTEEGETLTGTYDESKNTWTFGKGTELETVYTTAVYTVDVRPSEAEIEQAAAQFEALPLPDPSGLVTQQDVNWYLFDLINNVDGNHLWIGLDEPPKNNAGEYLFKFWWKDDEEQLYFFQYSTQTWVLTGLMDFDRPPIVSDTAPTEHPKFPGKDLEQGDLWYDEVRLEMFLWYNDAWFPISVPPADYDVEIERFEYTLNRFDALLQELYVFKETADGRYVNKEGGDSMEGPLDVTGGRTPDADGIVSTVKVLNVDSGQDSDLQIKHNGNTKVYVGSNRTTTTQGIKFNQNNLKITGSNDAELFTMNTNGVFYEGAYTADKHIATKQTVEEEIYDDITDKDNTNFFVRRDGDSMSGHLEMTSNAGIAFDELGDNRKALNLTRKDGEYPVLAHLNHVQGSSNLGGYDINVGGNTNFNELRLKGGTNATVPSFKMKGNGALYFYKDLLLDNNQITGLAIATADNHAVPYGQVKQELQEFRDDLIQNLTFGTWRYNSQSALPPTGRFFVRNDAGANSGVSPQSVIALTFHEDDLNGAKGAWDRVDVGELITMSSGSGLQVKYKVNSTAITSGPNGEIRTIEVVYYSKTGVFNFVDTIDWSVVLTEFEDISVDELDDTYLRLDADNSPVVTSSGLEIKTDANLGSGFGEAALTLNGKRDNANNSCAVVRFKNWNYGDTDEINGYITYFTNNDTHYFRFNKDIRLPGDVNLSFSDGGAIQHNGGNRIIFNSASNGNEGSGLVAFTRPGNNARRGVVIKGKYKDDDGNTVSDGDLFFTYTNTDVDAINYVGKISGKHNIVNKDYVDNANTGVLEGKLKNKGSNSSPNSGQFAPMFGASYNSGNVQDMNRIKLHSLDGYDFRTTGSAATPGTLTICSRGDCLWHGIIEKKSVSGDDCTLYLVKLYARSANWDTSSDYYFHISGFKRDLS